MIVDNLKNREFYIKKFPALSKVFDFILKCRDFAHTEEKRYEIDKDIYAVVGIYKPKEPREQKLEVHKKYTDLQYVVSGKDIIGWKSLNNCKDVFKEYDEKKDIVFFNETPDFNIMLNEGSFALFMPEDAHAPLCGKDAVLKCIVKIKRELF